MRSPIFIAFYTRGTLYEKEAARLVASLGKFGLSHDVTPIDCRGGWVENTSYTATHIARMQAKYPTRPIVYLDADAVIWDRPVIFEVLPESGADIAVHYRLGSEMLNGTIWLAPTEPARQVIEKYREFVIRHHPVNEQRMLQNAIAEMADTLKVHDLPAGYCFIPDIMKNDLAPNEQPVIAHMQASRERHNTDALQNRRAWIREMGAH